MGYRTAELPPVDLDDFAKIPFFPRMKMLQLHWVQYGFGTPKQTVMFYVWKIFYYALFGLIFCGAFTKGWSSTTSPAGGTSRSCTRS